MSRHRFAAMAGVLLLLSFKGSPASAQTLAGWEHYKAGTIAAVIEANDSSIRADTGHLPALIISGNRFPTLARVKYCGNSRPLVSTRLDVLRHWGRTFYRDTSVVLDFRREYLFQEGKELLWIPVQDTVASFFAGELKPGQAVSLYVMWAGAQYAGKDITWLFLVNEFQAGPAGPKCEASVVRAKAGAPPAD